MKLKKWILALGAAATVPGYAAIANGSSNNGELFLAVVDNVSRVSYTKDLGEFQDDFFVKAQSDAGYAQSWALNDPYFTQFLTQVNPAVLQWTVLASETFGGTLQGATRLFSTVKAGDEALVGTTSNLTFFLGIGAAQLGTFYNAVNSSGSHGAPGMPPNNAINGASVNYDTDSGNGFFGIPGSGDRINGNYPFSNANDVGAESNFFYVTRSGTNQLALVDVDPFNNATSNGIFKLAVATDGSYGLTYNLAAAVPEPGTYALMLLGLGAVAWGARRRQR